MMHNTPHSGSIELDKEGFLRNIQDWNELIAQEIATSESIVLSEEHWEIIRMARKFYQTYQTSPAMRALVKYIERELGAEKGRSLYLLQLFPNSPAKLISKIAGLPKPTNCL
jgi:tRNA 2-thiouridine synthesizing protein E